MRPVYAGAQAIPPYLQWKSLFSDENLGILKTKIGEKGLGRWVRLWLYPGECLVLRNQAMTEIA
ncbi:MAG: hypothetical protein AAFQ06_02930, partial [Pseudomonadota bacterium]